MNTFLAIYRGKRTYFWLLLTTSILYAPIVLRLLADDWSHAESGHGPIIVALSLWLLYQKWDRQSEGLDIDGARLIPVIAIYILAAALYVVGEVGDIKQLAYGSIVPFLAASVLMLQNRDARWGLAFPVLFLLFSIPLPGFIVDPITLPMKQLVAASTDFILSLLGYPIARSGVMLFVGPYELQVADACAGLRTLFTLEALGLLYLNLFESASVIRNGTLAILVVPISLISNVIRVVTLCLITYYWGDAAGQGYLHEFAGIVLFLCALLLLIAADSGIRLLVRTRKYGVLA